MGPGRHRVRFVPADLLSGFAASNLRSHEQRDAARSPVLHLHGAHSGALRHGGRPARHHRAAFRPGARRPRARGRRGRRAACGHDRSRRRVCHLHGADLAADHDALRLRPAPGDRRHRRLRNARADHPAEPRPDRNGRPARALGRRHVSGRDRSRPCPFRALPLLRYRDDDSFPEIRAGSAEGIPHHPRNSARDPRHRRADPAIGSDLPRARHHLHRARHPDRGRRHGRRRGACPCRGQRPAEPDDHPSGARTPRPSCRPSCFSS